MLCVCDVGHISIFVRQRARHGVKRDHRVVPAPKTARSPPARRSQESAAKFVFARGVGQARAVLLPVDGAVDGLVEVGVVAAALPRRHDAGAGAEHRPVAPRDLHAPGVQQPRHDLCGNQILRRVLNHRVVLHDIDATPARWRGGVVSHRSIQPARPRSRRERDLTSTDIGFDLTHPDMQE